MFVLFCFPSHPRKSCTENLKLDSKEDSKEVASGHSYPFSKTGVNHLQKQPSRVLKVTYQWAHLCSSIKHLPFPSSGDKVYFNNSSTLAVHVAGLDQSDVFSSVPSPSTFHLGINSHTKKSRFSCWTQWTHKETGPGGYETTGWGKSPTEDRGIPPDSKSQACKRGQHGPTSSCSTIQLQLCQAQMN